MTANKDTKKPAPEVLPSPREVPVPCAETRDGESITGAAGISKETHDAAIEEAVEGIHG